MSPKSDKTVAEIVQEYKSKFPEVPRRVLRRMLRTEKPALFMDNQSNLRKLDRRLKKEFEKTPSPALNARASQGSSETKKIQENNPVVTTDYYNCEKCGLSLIQRSPATFSSSYAPGLPREFTCPSCGFKNDIFKVYTERRNLAIKIEMPLKPNMPDAEVEKVLSAIELTRHELRFFREPTVNEIAAKLGNTPTAVKRILQELIQCHLTDWKEQLGVQAYKEAKKAIDLAGLLNWKKKGEDDQRLSAFCTSAINDATSDVIARAQKILINYPQLAPKINHIDPKWHPTKPKRPSGKGIVVPPSYDFFVVPQKEIEKKQVDPVQLLEWPQETKRIWQQVFGMRPPEPILFGP